MSIVSDPVRAQEVAELLYKAFNESAEGVFGYTTMPEDILPAGVEKGSREHRLFITLTVSIDYMRDAEALWAASRRAYENEGTRYLFRPEEVTRAAPAIVAQDLRNSGVALRRDQDGRIWRTVSITLARKWAGDPLNLVEAARYDAMTALTMVRREEGFPFLRGPKISALWVRMFRDNVGVPFANMRKVPIPMDVHVARATFSTAVLKGTIRGTLDQVRPLVETAWAKGLEGSRLIPLDIDEPLWHLSRYGCRRRGPAGCPVEGECVARLYCAEGLVRVSASGLEVDT